MKLKTLLGMCKNLKNDTYIRISTEFDELPKYEYLGEFKFSNTDKIKQFENLEIKAFEDVGHWHTLRCIVSYDEAVRFKRRSAL